MPQTSASPSANMNPQLFLLILFSAATFAMAADNTNQIRRMPSRNLRHQTNAVVKPSVPQAPKPVIKLGPRYDVNIAPGTAVIIASTNTFTASEARRWLQEAIRTLR